MVLFWVLNYLSLPLPRNKMKSKRTVMEISDREKGEGLQRTEQREPSSLLEWPSRNGRRRSQIPLSKRTDCQSILTEKTTTPLHQSCLCAENKAYKWCRNQNLYTVLHRSTPFFLFFYKKTRYSILVHSFRRICQPQPVGRANEELMVRE